jgi:hypothetical protein
MRIARHVLVGTFALCLLVLAGCQSNNKGKIVGKWETTAPIPGAELSPGAKLAMEFTSDNRITLDAFIVGNAPVSHTSATYRLGFGDTVYVDNYNPPLDSKTTSSVEQITINGDELKMKDENGKWLVFGRVKAFSFGNKP